MFLGAINFLSSYIMYLFWSPLWLSITLCILHSSTICLVDQRATPETRQLFYRLRTNARSGNSLIGTDSSTQFGEYLREGPCGPLNWDLSTGNMTDIKAICHKSPGIYGIDAAYIVGDFFKSHDSHDLDRLEKSRREVRQHMQDIYSRGGIVTIHYHMNNPIDGSKYDAGPKELWQIVSRYACEQNPLLKSMPRCGDAHITYRKKMGRLVSFLKSVTVDGIPVPVIFRPFHENNGDWFWWSPSETNKDAYHAAIQTVWQWTVNFVHNTEDHHAMLWAYAPAGGRDGGLTTANYFDLAPTLSQIDVLGYDRYGDFAGEAADGIREVRAVVELAERYGKIAAVTEIGHNYQGKRNMWPQHVWSKHTLGALKDDPVATRVAWMLMWLNYPHANSCEGQYFGPHANHDNAIDFRTVCAREDIILEGDAPFYE